MPADNERAFTNRRRAESFGSRAEQYDRARPGYPAELIDDLMALAPRTVLDVGCGTGKVAGALAARGVAVLGVEIDSRMAGVARSKGLAVETAGFERWEPAGRRFDLLVCGQAWHWIDPEAGARKASAVVEPGGAVALFWNLGSFAPPVQQAMDRIYAETAPELGAAVLRGGGHALRPYVEPLQAAGFGRCEQRSYHWRERYSRAGWLDLLATHSDHATLPERTFGLLRARHIELVDRLGGSLSVKYETRLLLASR